MNGAVQYLAPADSPEECAMATFSAHLAKAIYAARNGDTPYPLTDLQWRDTLTPASWAAGPLEREYTQAEAHKAARANILSRVVHREPCPRCGVRSDIGCKHQEAA